jgi:glycine cleavage system H protein
MWGSCAPFGLLKIEYCEFPDGLLYDLEQGTWGNLLGGVLRLGATSIVSWSFGSLSAVTVKEKGTEVSKGEVIVSLEGSRHFDVIHSPVSGTLVGINQKLVEEPELVNKDPYGEGWIADIKVKDASELQALGRLPEAEPMIAQALKDRHVRCFAAYPDQELFDVGVECAAVLVKLNEMMVNSSPGTIVHVISDDAMAEAEMKQWSEQTGNSILDSRKETSFHHFIVKKK